MKELSTEQKAKRYDEALEKIKNLVSCGLIYEDAAIQVFPELKESKDEKIRKVIYGWIYTQPSQFFDSGFSKEEMLTWLEKQGDKPQGKSALEAAKEEKVDNANKVEPKFKVGDWVTDGNITIQIEAIKNDCYLYCGDCVLYSTKTADKVYHLWTIQDAKDGDVLCCESGWTCIFKALDNHTNTFSSYCFMDNTKWFCETGSKCHTLDEQFIKAYNSELYPATKEQRNALFAKMKEAGYVWNAEKKELKKIEQKPAWSEDRSKELSLSLQIQAYLNTASDELYAKGKPLYSEERIEDIHKCMLMWQKLHNAYFYQKPAWSEEDEKHFSTADLMISVCPYNSYDGISKNGVHNWLKSIKDRVLPQPKQGWSEEEKARIDKIVDVLDWAEEKGYIRYSDWEDYVCYVKSLRPQNTWKPSDEQIEIFRDLIEDNNQRFFYPTLKSLYNDLKKLKG